MFSNFQTQRQANLDTGSISVAGEITRRVNNIGNCFLGHTKLEFEQTVATATWIQGIHGNEPRQGVESKANQRCDKR